MIAYRRQGKICASSKSPQSRCDGNAKQDDRGQHLPAPKQQLTPYRTGDCKYTKNYVCSDYCRGTKVGNLLTRKRVAGPRRPSHARRLHHFTRTWLNWCIQRFQQPRQRRIPICRYSATAQGPQF